MTNSDDDGGGERRKRWWETRESHPLGPKRVTDSGATQQERSASFTIQPFPEPDVPVTEGSGVQPGWVPEIQRGPTFLRSLDYDFRPVTEAASRAESDAQKAKLVLDEAKRVKRDDWDIARLEKLLARHETARTKGASNLAACAWYEYARESAKVRAIAATYAMHAGIGGGIGRMSRYRKGTHRWAREKKAHDEMMRPKAVRLYANLNARIEGLKRDGHHSFAEKFGRKWANRINDMEVKDPTPTLEWTTTDPWMRIEWLQDKVKKRLDLLRTTKQVAKATRVAEKWLPKIERAKNAERAWTVADEWMGRIQGSCSIGAPCLRTLAQWLGDDCSWQKIRHLRQPKLDVRALAISRGPSADDPLWKGGKGRHPIAGLSGGLQMHRGFETVSPRSAFFNRTGRYGEHLSDDTRWSEAMQFKGYRAETFVARITWNRPNSEILDDFEKWLLWRRSLQPDEFKNMAQRPTRTRWDDPAAALSDLAALRLRARCKAAAGSAEWGELYSPGNIQERLATGSIERQTRRAAADASQRFAEWMPGWNLDSKI